MHDYTIIIILCAQGIYNQLAVACLDLVGFLFVLSSISSAAFDTSLEGFR